VKILPLALLAGGAYLLWSSRNSSLQGLGWLGDDVALAAAAKRVAAALKVHSGNLPLAAPAWKALVDQLAASPNPDPETVRNASLAMVNYITALGNPGLANQLKAQTVQVIDAARSAVAAVAPKPAEPPPSVPTVPGNNQGTSIMPPPPGTIIPQGTPTIAFRCASGAVLKMPDGKTYRAGPLPGYIGTDKSFDNLADATAYARSFPAEQQTVVAGGSYGTREYKGFYFGSGTGGDAWQADSSGNRLLNGRYFNRWDDAKAWVDGMLANQTAKPPGSGTTPLVTTQPPADLTTGVTTVTTTPPSSLTPPPVINITTQAPSQMPVQQIQTAPDQQVAAPAATGKINPLVTVGVLAAVPLVMGFMGGK
jgi:hypothetical protein